MKQNLEIALGAVQEIRHHLTKEIIDHCEIADAAAEAEGRIEAAIAALESEPLEAPLAEGCCQACGRKLRPGERHGSRGKP